MGEEVFKGEQRKRWAKSVDSLTQLNIDDYKNSSAK